MKKVFVAMSALLLLVFTSCETTDVPGIHQSENTGGFVIEAVDMGLSVKWGNANLGASSIDDYGNYYAWGELELKNEFTLESYKWYGGEAAGLTKYNNNSNYGTVDDKNVLEAEDDVASVKLGNKWRMPTKAEIEELVATRDSVAKYKWEWTTINDHNGWLVTCLANSNTLFLPASGNGNGKTLYRVGSEGYFWSASNNWSIDKKGNSIGSSYRADRIGFSSTQVEVTNILRYYAQPVRPVSE